MRPDFLIIPGPVAFSDDLQPLDKNVYGVIYWLHGLKNGECTASNAYLAKICGATARSVQKALERLEGSGFIAREFKDEARKKREVIVPLVEYRVRPNGRTGTSKRTYRVRPNGRQISNRDKEERKDIVATEKSVATDGSKKELKEEKPMVLDQFVEWCGKSPHQHVQIIGEWAETTKPDFKTVAQWEAYIKRNLRASRSLAPFSHDQLAEGFTKIKAAIAKGWLTTYTLETLFKFITNVDAKK